MKNKLLLASALFVAAAAGAQTQTPATPAQPATPNPNQPAQAPATTPATNAPATTQAPVQTVLADTSINAAYVSNPEELKGLTTETLRPEHSFPVLGSFQASGSSTESVTITLDETNKGIVWVEGLPQGKFKALMKKAPATYKIPAQTTESGKSVSEGTLFYNPSSKEVSIVLGRAFNDADPAASLTIPAKSKTKITQYTGTKATAPATAVTPASQQ
jgi:glucose/arabinose dehydrogenase